MTVHLAKDNTWHACRPRTRACALPVHLEMTLAEANTLPAEMMKPLLQAYMPPTEVQLGTQIWRDGRGELHRDYGLPAVIVPGYTEEWWRHGSRHRGDDKPAVVFADGRQEWFVDDMRHRDGGKPAIVWPNGKGRYFVNGTFVGDTE